jgi:hypothetical protein
VFIHDEQGLQRSHYIAVTGGDGIFNSRIIQVSFLGQEVNGHRWLRASCSIVWQFWANHGVPSPAGLIPCIHRAFSFPELHLADSFLG